MTKMSTTEPLEGTESQQPDLFAFCYLMLGSLHEALTAVRMVSERVGARGRTPLSGWYAEALTECVDRGATRRLPTSLGAASSEPEGDLDRRSDLLWLEPVPDALVEGVGGRFDLDVVAALQHLPARERAALVLREYSGFGDASVAELLQLSRASVTDLIGRDRHRVESLARRGGLPEEGLQRELLGRWAAAFEAYDVDAITGLLTDDAIWEMPPFAAWFRGASSIGRLVRTACPAKAAGDQVMVPLRANHQPGFALYMLDPHTGAHRAFQLQVLTLTAAGVVHTVAFFDLTLFDAFGLPQLLSDLNSTQPSPTDPVAASAGTPRGGAAHHRRRRFGTSMDP